MIQLIRKNRMKSKSEYVWAEIKDWILMLWTLPQSLLGLIVVAITGAKPCKKWINGIEHDYFVAKRLNNSWSGVSLGEFIIFAREIYADNNSIKHEYGHHIQSNYLGLFYLLVVGLPSIVGNLWDRVAHKNWTETQRIVWYYSRFPENWADKLGGVKRF